MLSAQIKNFTRAAQAAQGKELPKLARMPTEADLSFIKRMVLDEMDELMEAQTIGDVADAMADAFIYMADFSARQGIDLDAFIRIAHAANMRKIVDGQVILEKEGPRAGKILKPEGWVPPDKQVEDEGFFQSVGSYRTRSEQVYLASPYTSGDYAVMDDRAETAAKAVYALSMFFPGKNVYSPIAYYHEISKEHGLPRNSEYWLKKNKTALLHSDVLCVLCIPGWKESVGIQDEKLFAESIGLPVIYARFKGEQEMQLSADPLGWQ